MRRAGLASTLAILATIACIPAWAASPATGSFQVSITIEDSCVIVSTNNLSFGTQGALSAVVNATTTLSVQCTTSLPYSIALSVGDGSGATTAVRK